VFEAEQAHPWLAGSVREIALRDVGAARLPVLVIVTVAVNVPPPSIRSSLWSKVV
jgi:hypothetical protein